MDPVGPTLRLKPRDNSDRVAMTGNSPGKQIGINVE